MKEPLTITRDFQFTNADQLLSLKMIGLLPMLADWLHEKDIVPKDSSLPSDLHATAKLLDRLTRTAFCNFRTPNDVFDETTQTCQLTD